MNLLLFLVILSWLRLLRAVGSQRTVSVILDIDVNSRFKQFSDQDQIRLPSHAQLHIAQSDSDGAVRIQVLFDGTTSYVDMLDFAQYSRDPGIYPGYGMARKIMQIGTTTVTNAQLMDDNNRGAGILRELWTDPKEVFQGKYFEGVSDCMTFVDKLINRGSLGTGVIESNDWDGYFKLYKDYVDSKKQANLKPTNIDNVGLRHRLAVSQDANTNRLQVFPINSGTTAVLPPPSATTADVSSNSYQDPISGDTSDLTRIVSPNEEHQYSAGRPGSSFKQLPSPFQACQRSLEGRSGCSPPANNALDEVTFARVDGVASMVAMTSQAAVQAIGVAGAALGAAVVILDFVAGDWKGAAFGAANLVLGVGVGIAMDGPIGWLVGGLITAFFAILPRLFGGHVAKKPKNNNITQIIQYQMFGDASHTGNEQCQKTNPNCQAVYGPGVLALTFGWEYFDAVTFLIAANQGYPISIPNMASAFTFNTNGNATVHCDGPIRNANAYGSYSDLQDRTVCYNPKFTLNRKAITLPHIDQTADKVYGRIIPNPGGDCKLIDDASKSVFFSGYNVTVTGLPVAIACNITAGTNVDGVVVPLGTPASPSGAAAAPATLPSSAPTQGPGAPPVQASGETPTQSSGPAPDSTSRTPYSNSNNNSSNAPSSTPAAPSSAPSGSPPANSLPLYSPGNESTNGQSGAYIAPPPATPFQPAFNETNSVCFSGPSTGGNNVCFPNGTYTLQKGMYGYATTDINAMIVPQGASITLNWRANQQVRGGDRLQTATYQAGSYDSTQQGWKFVYSQFKNKMNNPSMIVNATSPPMQTPVPPAACLFSEPNFTGQVFCLGLGGGNLTSQQANTAQSIRVFGGATAYLFAETGYADGSETPVTTDVKDLKSEPYGTNDNFSGKVKAVWVRGP